MKEMADAISELIQRVGIPVGVMIYYLVKDYMHGNKIIMANTAITKSQEDQVKVQEQTTEALGKMASAMQEQKVELARISTKLEDLR